MEDKTDIMIVDERSLRDKIHVSRGQQVMLDFELAEIYGFETKNFNRQVKNNKEKFPEDMKNLPSFKSSGAFIIELFNL